MKSVLVVDDEPLIANGIAMLLKRSKTPITVAGVALDAASALAVVAAQKIDIVISDINMPGMNGIELLKAIHTQQPACQLIVLTGFGTLSYAKEAMALGVQHFLEKPLVPADLFAALQQTIAASDERQDESRLMFKRDFERFVRSGGETPAPEGLPEYLYLFDARQYQSFNRVLANDLQVLCGTIAPVAYLLAAEPLATATLIAQVKPGRGLMIACRVADAEAVLQKFCLAKRHVDKAFYCDDFCVVDEARVLASESVDQTLYTAYRQQLASLLTRCEVSKAIDTTEQFFTACKTQLYPVQLLRLQVNELLAGLVVDHQLQLDESLQDYTAKVMLLDRVAELQYLLVHALTLLREALSATTNATMAQQVNMIIEQEFAQDGLSLKWIAANRLHVNPEHLGKVYYRETGQRFNKYLATYRIEQAKKLLWQNYKVYEVASMVGFGETPEYFVQTFRKQVGVTPKQYVATKDQAPIPLV